MPHKRNPVASLIGIAAALRTPSRVACLMAAMPQEHERGLGSWQAELAEWPDLVIAVGGSTHAMATALEGLQVFAPRMRANIEATNGSVFAEAAAALLADVLPPGAGAALVGELCADIAKASPPPHLQALLLKAMRRTALRGRIDARQVRALFAIEPIVARLAERTRQLVEAIGNEAGMQPPSDRRADSARRTTQSKQSASTARKPVARRERVG